MRAGAGRRPLSRVVGAFSCPRGLRVVMVVLALGFASGSAAQAASDPFPWPGVAPGAPVGAQAGLTFTNYSGEVVATCQLSQYATDPASPSSVDPNAVWYDGQVDCTPLHSGAPWPSFTGGANLVNATTHQVYASGTTVDPSTSGYYCDLNVADVALGGCTADANGQWENSSGQLLEVQEQMLIQLPSGWNWVSYPTGCSPDPGTPDLYCNEYSAPFSFNAAVPQAEQIVNNSVADAQCAASQAGPTPQTPGSGQTLCQTAQTGVATVNAALQLVNNTAKTAQAEGGCIQGQLPPNAPNPSAPDPAGTGACGDVGSAVATAESAPATAGNVVKYGQSEAQCVQGQVQNPDPSNGDQLCKTIGQLIPHIGGGQWSNTCTSPTAVVADGYVGSVYVKMREQPNPTAPQTTWICYRAVGGPADVGGRLDVTGGSVSPALPSMQPIPAGTDPCNASENLIANPHPLFQGSVGDPSSPPYTSLSVDAFASSSQVSLCLVGTANPGPSFAEQAIVPVSTATVPTLVSNVDAPPIGADSPGQGPSGYPSSTCQANGGQQLADMNSMGDQVWAFSYQPNANQIDICARQQGQLTAGGMLSINASSGVSPVLNPNADPTPCTAPNGVQVVSISSPVQLSIRRTPTGQNPAMVCVSNGSSTSAYELGYTGTLNTNPITWSPDPDTA